MKTAKNQWFDDQWAAATNGLSKSLFEDLLKISTKAEKRIVFVFFRWTCSLKKAALKHNTTIGVLKKHVHTLFSKHFMWWSIPFTKKRWCFPKKWQHTKIVQVTLKKKQPPNSESPSPLEGRAQSAPRRSAARRELRVALETDGFKHQNRRSQNKYQLGLKKHATIGWIKKNSTHALYFFSCLFMVFPMINLESMGKNFAKSYGFNRKLIHKWQSKAGNNL